jgi:hypothetical protein
MLYLQIYALFIRVNGFSYLTGKDISTGLQGTVLYVQASQLKKTHKSVNLKSTTN